MIFLGNTGEKTIMDNSKSRYQKGSSRKCFRYKIENGKLRCQGGKGYKYERL